MFEKILAELKTKYKDLGLSEPYLKAKARQMAKAVESEEQIADAVNEVEDDLKLQQSQEDQLRTLKTELANLKKPKAEEPKDKEGGEEPKIAGDANDAVLQMLKEMKEELTSFRTEKAQQTNAQKLQSKLEELKVSKSYLDLLPQSPTEMNFQSDEEIELFATGLKSKSDVYEQSISNGLLGQAAKPLFGESIKEGDVSPEVQALIDSKKPKTNE